MRLQIKWTKYTNRIFRPNSLVQKNHKWFDNLEPIHIVVFAQADILLWPVSVQRQTPPACADIELATVSDVQSVWGIYPPPNSLTQPDGMLLDNILGTLWGQIVLSQNNSCKDQNDWIKPDKSFAVVFATQKELSFVQLSTETNIVVAGTFFISRLSTSNTSSHIPIEITLILPLLAIPLLNVSLLILIPSLLTLLDSADLQRTPSTLGAPVLLQSESQQSPHGTHAQHPHGTFPVECE